MNYAVIIQPRAEEDVQEIYYWLRKRSPLGAVRWYATLLSTLLDLSKDAERFGQANEAKWLGRDVRECFFKTRQGRRYRLLFIIVDLEVLILRVWRPGQRSIRRRDVDL